jgi:hypothetical protein
MNELKWSALGRLLPEVSVNSRKKRFVEQPFPGICRRYEAVAGRLAWLRPLTKTILRS